MAGYFFDSSETVKRYVREAGTTWTIGLFRDSNQNSFYSARITLAEVISAFSRRLKKRKSFTTANLKSKVTISAHVSKEIFQN